MEIRKPRNEQRKEMYKSFANDFKIWMSEFVRSRINSGKSMFLTYDFEAIFYRKTVQLLCVKSCKEIRHAASTGK